MLSRIIFFFWITVSFFSPLSTSWAAGEKLKDGDVVQVDKQVTVMNNILIKLYKEIAKAKEQNEIHRLNCLTVKRNLVKGLLKAVELAKGLLMESFFDGDTDTAKLYKKKITSYSESASEVEKSIDECAGIKGTLEGTTLVYIRPEGEDELKSSQSSPWDWNYNPGAEGYPAVPPASPFR